MSRLIDAEDFSRVIKEYCKDCIDHNKHKMDVVDINADIQDFLDNQPTAYDVDKVLKELQSYKDDIRQWNDTYTSGQISAYERAITIVKAGGMNENR